MNPLTNVKNVNKMNEKELSLGLAGSATSWHAQYKDSAWIFVGGLPFELTEGDILCVFSQYGEIVNINMVRDKDTGKFKGFGFICYEDQRSTVLAVDNLNGIKLLNRTVRVDHCQNYKQPKEFGNEDDVTQKIRQEGCAPSLIKLESVKKEKPKKAKKIKKEKKKKQKKKKSRKSSSSESSSSEEAATVTVKKEKQDAGYDKYDTRKTSEESDARDNYRADGRKHRAHSEKELHARKEFGTSKTRDNKRDFERHEIAHFSNKSSYENSSRQQQSAHNEDRSRSRSPVRRSKHGAHKQDRSRSRSPVRRQQQSTYNEDRSRSRSPVRRPKHSAHKQDRSRSRSPVRRQEQSAYNEDRSRSRSPVRRPKHSAHKQDRSRSRSPVRKVDDRSKKSDTRTSYRSRSPQRARSKERRRRSSS